MRLNCAIIDDEPLAAELMASYVEKTPFLHLTGTYHSAITAMKDLREQPVDLIFMDIQMPELSGLEFARVLPTSTKIIFTTAFKQYAIDGYKVNALHYLLKPVSYEDFLEASHKAIDWFNANHKQEACREDRFLFIKSDYKLVRVSLDDILYIEGLKDYVRLYLSNGQKIVTLMNMKRLDEFFPKPEFLRVHRSYIVHMTKAESVDRMRIVFGDTFIPISESYKDSLQDYFERHTL